jgi:dolichyl-phosphate beta-glucosyltransferase
MEPRLSVIIPAYNEENHIAETLMDVSKYLQKQDYVSEIIVVDDGSKDKTAEIAKKMEGVIHFLRVIENKKNQGKGAVVKQGMLGAQGQYCIYVDADNAISINQIENFWPYIKEGYEVVIGSIEVPGAVKEEKYVFYRKILGKFSKYLIRALTIWSIHDTQRAFKLFSQEATKKIFPRQTIMRWGFDIEILVIAKKLGYKIKELPVRWINPAGGRVNFLSYLRTLRELLQIKFNLIKGKYDE